MAQPTGGIGFQGPIGPSQAVGAKTPPITTPNPNLQSGTSGNWLAGAGDVINNDTSPGPVSFLHIGQGLESPDVVNYHNYQLSDKINSITTQVPALKSHPGIVYAIATNQDIPIDPNMVASIVAARNLLGTLGKYTPDQYRKDQTALAAQEAAAHPSNISRAMGWISDHTLGYWDQASRFFSGEAPTGPRTSPLSQNPVPSFVATAINSLGTGSAFTPGNEIAAVDPNAPNMLKPVAKFIELQLDMPQQMYRTYETVKEQHGSAAAMLTLLPAVVGAVVGFALTGAVGGEGAGVGAEVGASIAARLIAGASEEAIAAGAAEATAGAISQMEMGAIMRAVVGRLVLLERFGAPTANVVSKFVAQPIARALSSGTLLGANVGANVGGQIVFRQDFMDARDGTEWAKKHPNLAPTLGQGLFGRNTILSGITDFLAAVAAPDMIGGIGKLARDAKSVEGMKGVLGGHFKPGEMAPRELKLWKMKVPDINAWFGRQYDAKIGRYWTGTAMENVYHAYDETGGVRNAINLIASMTSATQVMDMDQRLVPIAHRLVEAAKHARERHPGDEMNAAVEAVKKVFSRAAASNELLTTGQLPFVGSKLYDTMVHNLSESRLTNPKNMFSSLPRYNDLLQHKVNIHDFKLGDKSAVPAIRDLFRLLTGDEDLARGIADILLSTDDPGIWNNAYFALHAGIIQVEAVRQLTGKKVSADIAKLFLRTQDDKIDTELRKLLNVGGPGGSSRFGYGTVLHEDGAVSSKDLAHIDRSIEKAKNAIDDPEHFFERGGTDPDSRIAKMENPANWKDAIDNAAARGDRKLVTRLEKRRAEEIQEALLSDLDKDIADKGYPEFSKHAQGSAEEIATELSKFKAHQEAVAANKAAAIKRNKTWTGWDQIKQKLQDQGSLTRITGTESLPAETTALLTQFAKNVGEDLFNDVKLTYSAKTDSVLGSFDFANAVIKLYPKAIEKGGEDFVRTAFHEFYHNLTRFTPESFVGGIEKSLVKGREKFLKENPELKGILDPSTKVKWDETFGSRKLKEIIAKAHPELDKDGVKDLIRKHFRELTDGSGNIVGYQWNMRFDVMANYRLTNTDEHFAERMADMARSRFKLPEEGSIWQSIQEAFRKLLGAVQAVIGQKGMRRLFEQFNNGKYSGSEMVREFGFAGGKTTNAQSIGKAVGEEGATGVKGAHTSLPDPEDPLLGEHPLSEVADEAGSTTTAAVTLAETARLHMPNLAQLNKNMDQAIALVLKNSDKIKVDVADQIVEIDEKLSKLAERIAKSTSEEYKAKLVEQHSKLSFQKDELQILGFNVKKDAAISYAQFKNGVAMTGNSVYNGLDKIINTLIFKPLALLTGGWATRTGTSEVIANVFRQGPVNYVAGQAARQVARHERAILAVGKSLTAPRAEDIAARIDKVVTDMGLPTFEGKAFESEEEAQNFIAALHEATAKIDLMQAHFSGDFAGETAAARAGERRAAAELSMSPKELDKAVGKARRHATKAYGWQLALKMVNKQDLFDAAVRLMYLNNGHMIDPMLNAIHTGVAHDVAIENPEGYTLTAARMSFFGINSNKLKVQKARLSSEFRDYHPDFNSTSVQYPAVRQRRALWLMADPQRMPVIQAYAIGYQQALNDGLKGVSAIKAAREVAHAKALEVLDTMTDGEKAFMLRQRRQMEPTNPFAARLKEETKDLDPEEKAKFDHASALVYTTESVWLGPNGYFQKELLGDMANGTVPKFGELKEFYKRYHLDIKGGTDMGNFSVLPGPELDRVSGFFRTLANGPTVLATKMHSKVLGPIVNNMSRNPMMIIEFAAERKMLEKKVLEKSLSSDQADVLAQTRALTKSIKYIHNPADKLKFENMVRLFAPFYFAENQAWRRLGRLAMSDPGAAEQYIKSMYLTQEAIYNYNEEHNSTGIPIPGSAWVTKHLTGLWGSAIAVPLNASMSSLKTVMPWSAETGKPPGFDSLISSIMPQGGLAVSFPAAVYLETANDTPVYDPRIANFFGKYVLGDQGIGQPLLLQLVPNSIMGNVIKGIWGFASAATHVDPNGSKFMNGIGSDVTGPYITVYNHVLAENINQLQQSIWNKHKNDMPDSSWSGTTEQYRVAKMLAEVSKELDPKTPDGKYQEIMDRTNNQTATLWMLKTLISAGSPMSTMLDRADAQFNTKFQELINSEGSITKAFDKYTQMYPWATASTVFTSKSTQGVSYPETETAVQWLLHNGSVVDKYKAGARYLIPEGELLKGRQPYSQFAHFIESSWALRQQQSPSGFMNSYLDSVFNQYYYGILNKVAAHYVNTGQISGSQAYSWLTNPNAKVRDPSTWRALEVFGYKYAPTALGDHQQGKQPTRDKVFTDLQSMVSDPVLRQKYPILEDMKSQLFDKALPWLNAAEGSKSWDRAGLAKAWNDNLDTLETEQNGRYASLIPVIEGVFRPMKPMFLY